MRGTPHLAGDGATSVSPRRRSAFFSRRIVPGRTSFPGFSGRWRQRPFFRALLVVKAARTDSPIASIRLRRSCFSGWRTPPRTGPRRSTRSSEDPLRRAFFSKTRFPCLSPGPSVPGDRGSAQRPVREEDRVEHLLLGDLVRLSLDHQDRVAGSATQMFRSPDRSRKDGVDHQLSSMRPTPPAIGPVKGSRRSRARPRRRSCQDSVSFSLSAESTVARSGSRCRTLSGRGAGGPGRSSGGEDLELGELPSRLKKPPGSCRPRRSSPRSRRTAGGSRCRAGFSERQAVTSTTDSVADDRRAAGLEGHRPDSMDRFVPDTSISYTFPTVMDSLS